MPTASELKSMYARFCQHTITVRRYNGTAKTDYVVKGNARQYIAKELVAGISQGDWKVILRADSLKANGFQFPLLTQDKIVLNGREKSILTLSDRSSLDQILIAYEAQCRG